MTHLHKFLFLQLQQHEHTHFRIMHFTLKESIFYCQVAHLTAHDIILHSNDDGASSAVLKPVIRNTLCGCIKVQKLGNNSKK